MAEEISGWLQDLGLGKYVEAFVENEITLDELPALTEDDLKELGLPMGPRKRVLKAIDALKGSPRDTAVAADDSEVLSPEPATAAPVERRQLTVMFCDLVGSTELSGRLDPEDLREVMRRYQDTVAGVVTRFEGHLAKFLGDGVLAYFGWPRAHEDQAERAVRSGLAAIDAVADVKTEDGQTLPARVGIATGQVVIGDIVGETATEADAVAGETPNLAARLQAVASPGQVVIGATTRLLIGETFELAELGAQSLKGFAEPVAAWRVVGESAAESRFEAAHPGALTQFVGREHELGLLRRAWQQSQDGVGQVVLISGEPGIGKSRLVDALRAELGDNGYTRITLGCSPYHTNSALFPFIVHLERVLRWQREDSAEVKLAKLEGALQDFSLPLDEAIPLFASLLSLPLPEDRYLPITVAPQQQKQQTLDATVAWLLESAETQPVLQVWEDLHWADPSSLELLALEIEQVPTARILNVLTFRPGFTPPWPQRSHMTPLTLNRLERPEVEALIGQHTGGRALPEEVVEHIAEKTDGVPLYVEELTKAILEADFLREHDGGYRLTGPMSGITIPATLQDSLMARLDRLPNIRELAQLGSVLGREFAYEMISGLSTSSDAVLQQGLGQLVDAKLLYQRGRPPRARYIFKHALVQDAAYGSLLRRTRQQYHLQVAKLMEARYPELIETHPELIAHHYGAANLADRAIDYLQKAGERSLLKSANEEAIAHLGKGLEIIRGMRDGSEWEQHELSMLMMTAPALVAARGYAAPEVEPTYRRALELCRKLGDVEKEFSVLLGQSMFHFLKAEILLARNLAEQAVDLARTYQEPGFDLAAARQLGLVLCFQGDSEVSTACFEKVATSYDAAIHGTFAFRRGGSDFGVGALATSGFALVALGYPDQARTRCAEALALARKLDHPISEAYAHWVAAFVHRERGELEAALDHAAATMAIAEDKGFPQYVAWITALRGRVCLDQGAVAEAIAEIRKGIAANHATGARLLDPNWAAGLADAYGRNGEAEQGLVAIAEALDHFARTEERYVEAEIYRIKGKLLLAGDAANESEAAACFRRAIEVAQSQKAKLWELRAATNLARLWFDQGKRDDARDLLTAVYDWFTEGFETTDLKEAKVLLDELS